MLPQTRGSRLSIRSVSRSARKELQHLAPAIAARVIQRVETLVSTPHPPGSVKLEGSANLWRIRIGDYRVVYSVDDKEHRVDVFVVRHRRDAYR